MVSGGELMTLFCDSTPPILELSEIKEWYREKQVDGSSLEVSCEGCFNKVKPTKR